MSVGNASTLLSFFVMVFSKRLLPFSEIGVSVLGGVFHNAGQIIAAIILMENTAIAYYMVPLVISGTLAGIAVGVLGGIVTRRIKLKGKKGL